MGAQDHGGSWLELPFWRMVKYYGICLLFGFFLGIVTDKIWYWTSWWQSLAMYVADFHVTNWWLFLLYTGFASIVATVGYYDHKKRVKERKRKEQIEKIIQPLTRKEG